MMHVGHDENTRYYLEQDGKKWELHTTNEDKDLGVIVSSNLKVSRQCMTAANKVNRVLGMVNRQFRDLQKASVIILYKGFIRLHLEYAIQAWPPYLKKDIEYLEKVQRRATKLVKGTGSMPHDKRLHIAYSNSQLWRSED